MTWPTVIRTPNHLGDLVMALPALDTVPDADLLAVRWLTPLLEMRRLALGEGAGRVLPLDRGGRGVLAAAGRLRRGRYRRGIVLPPSFSSALVMALGGVRHRRGTATDGRGPLLTERVVLPRSGAAHRASTYWALVTGELPAEPPVPRLPVPEEQRDRWRALVGSSDAPLVGVFPGSNAPSRRWDADRYAALVRRVAGTGARVAVFGSGAERGLTAAVAGEAGIDLGGRTDLPLLAAGLSACHLLVTNDSGPMHLAAAVGTATVSVQGPADPRATRPLGESHEMVWGGELPCIPCVKNECPRRGRGYLLPEAERECMKLIAVDAVESAVLRRLGCVTPERGADRVRR